MTIQASVGMHLDAPWEFQVTSESWYNLSQILTDIISAREWQYAPLFVYVPLKPFADFNGPEINRFWAYKIGTELDLTVGAWDILKIERVK